MYRYENSRLFFLASGFGVRCCFRRGNANNGANAGLSYLEIDDGLSNANAHWSSPLSCLEGVCPSKTFWEKDLGSSQKNNGKGIVLVGRGRFDGS